MSWIFLGHPASDVSRAGRRGRKGRSARTVLSSSRIAPQYRGARGCAVNISWRRIGLEARRVNKLDRAPAEFPSEVRACRQHHSTVQGAAFPGRNRTVNGVNPHLTPPYLRGNRCFCRDDAGSVQLNRSAELPQTTRLPILTASRSTGIRWILRSQDGCSPRLFF